MFPIKHYLTKCLIFPQGNRQRHKETARCGQRDRLVHTGRYGQAGCGAAKEGVCQIFQEVQHNAEGVLQRRTVSVSQRQLHAYYLHGCYHTIRGDSKIAGFFNRLISGFLSFRANRLDDVMPLAFRAFVWFITLRRRFSGAGAKRQSCLF